MIITMVGAQFLERPAQLKRGDSRKDMTRFPKYASCVQSKVVLASHYVVEKSGEVIVEGGGKVFVVAGTEVFVSTGVSA